LGLSSSNDICFCRQEIIGIGAHERTWILRCLVRIGLTADPEIPVPPMQYGGIERIVDMLARGLVARGHEVTVFAHPRSATAGNLVPWPGPNSRSGIDTARNAITLARKVMAGRFDLLHSFSRIAYLSPILPLQIPKLMTYQREISRRSVRLGHTLSRGTLWFSAISRAMMYNVADVGTWRLVFNGVPLSTYEFRSHSDPFAPLVFLGRIEEIKGPHLAIEIARRAGVPLVIAGNIPAEHRSWYEAQIAPYIDGENVTYIGPVDDRQKNELLGRARALLMPILWEEPFGIVMAEAMACGTPVLGFARGAVPEVVEHGITGFVVNNIDDFVAAVGRLGELNRAACRSRVERLYSDAAVVEGYLAVYAEMLAFRTRRVAA
jgi:glycosyltransferase involved in cell wall biosynthesis